MATKPIPDAVIDLLIHIDLTLDYPSQIFVESQHSSRVSTINRGYPFWLITARFKDTYNAALGRAMERWILSFDGRANDFTIPIFKATLPATASARTITGSSVRADGTLVHTISSNAMLTDEMFVMAGGHLYRLEEITGNSIVLNPQRPISNGTSVTRATEITAFLESAQFPDNPMQATSRADTQRHGPWIISGRTR